MDPNIEEAQQAYRECEDILPPGTLLTPVLEQPCEDELSR